jgi:hypothetical protein
MTVEYQKLARGVSHNVGGVRYENEMPLAVFQKLPEKIQGKLKAALKKEEDDAAKVEAENKKQAEKTEADQVKAQKEKDEAEKKKTGKG